MIGPFTVVRRIGGGGMGAVFAATQAGLDREVALKVIAPNLADDPDFRRRFVSEAHAMAALDSPHVIHVYAHGDEDDRLYIATQLIPDGDLAAMIGQLGVPPLGVALDLAAQVADGLNDAHNTGLVHRDVKPANILVRRRSGEFRAYITDFGIARRADAQATQSGVTAGTTLYMAPELHTGGQASPASDIYSLGCLLWVLVAGHAPYAGDTDYQLVQAHLHDEVPQLPGTAPVVAEVNRILRRAMAKDPADRYPSGASLRGDLRRAAAMLGVGDADTGHPSVPGVVPDRDQQTAPKAAFAAPGPGPDRADAPGPGGSDPDGPGGSGPRAGRRRGLLVALAVGVAVVCLTGAGYLAYGQWLSDDDASAGEPESSASAEPSRSPGASPSQGGSPGGSAGGGPAPGTAPGGVYRPRTAAERKASASLTTMFLAEGLTRDQATCSANQLIGEVGVERLVAKGVLTPQYEQAVTFDEIEDPAVNLAAANALVYCALPPVD